MTVKHMIEERILDGRIDIGVVEGRPLSEYIHMEKLMRDRFCLVLPPAHPLRRKDSISLGDVVQYPLLLREKGSAGTVVRRTLSDALFSRTNYIAYHKQKYLSPALGAFLKICRETMGQGNHGDIL